MRENLFQKYQVYKNQEFVAITQKDTLTVFYLQDIVEENTSDGVKPVFHFSILATNGETKTSQFSKTVEITYNDFQKLYPIPINKSFILTSPVTNKKFIIDKNKQIDIIKTDSVAIYKEFKVFLGQSLRSDYDGSGETFQVLGTIEDKNKKVLAVTCKGSCFQYTADMFLRRGFSPANTIEKIIHLLGQDKVYIQSKGLPELALFTGEPLWEKYGTYFGESYNTVHGLGTVLGYNEDGLWFKLLKGNCIMNYPGLEKSSLPYTFSSSISSNSMLDGHFFLSIRELFPACPLYLMSKDQSALDKFFKEEEQCQEQRVLLANTLMLSLSDNFLQLTLLIAELKFKQGPTEELSTDAKLPILYESLLNSGNSLQKAIARLRLCQLKGKDENDPEIMKEQQLLLFMLSDDKFSNHHYKLVMLEIAKQQQLLMALEELYTEFPQAKNIVHRPYIQMYKAVIELLNQLGRIYEGTYKDMDALREKIIKNHRNTSIRVEEKRKNLVECLNGFYHGKDKYKYYSDFVNKLNDIFDFDLVHISRLNKLGKHLATHLNQSEKEEQFTPFISSCFFSPKEYPLPSIDSKTDIQVNFYKKNFYCEL